MPSDIVELLQPGNGKQQLVCFPYLGGHAQVFQSLCAHLSDDFEVWAINPPGHGVNQSVPLKNMEQMVELYVKELLPILKPDAILLGHSLGGIVAYFVTQQLMKEKDNDYSQLTLTLSACNTPCAFRDKHYAQLPNEQLIDHLAAYGGLPEELLAERELLDFFMPMIRADFHALQSSAELSFVPLHNQVYFLWGTADRTVDLSAAMKWSRYLVSTLQLIPIKQGSHMFIMEQAEEIAAHIRKIAQSSVSHILN